MKKIFKLRNILLIIAIVLFMIPIASCSSNSSSAPISDDRNTQTGNSSTNDLVDSNGRKVIYSINYRYEADDINPAIKEIKTKVLEFGGYISESYTYENYARYTYKLPTSKVNEMMDYIDEHEGFGNKSSQTTDVTSTYDSVEASISRLNAKKKIYEDELNNNQNLTVDEKLRYVELIEQVDRELQSYYAKKDELDGSIDYSTLSIYYYKNKNADWGKDFGNVMLKALQFVGVSILVSAPFVLVGGIVFIVLAKKKKKEE